ncbi:MAG: hypothetical protein DMF40_13385 [Verrucomicrobia bacterium]|nr:MAG: hypothetical protein DMF40_13385 [Verrucomicrobiota bacterium]
MKRESAPTLHASHKQSFPKQTSSHSAALFPLTPSRFALYVFPPVVHCAPPLRHRIANNYGTRTD